MKDCPEIKDLAHFVETGEGSRRLQAHLARCDACQEVRANLEDEAREPRDLDLGALVPRADLVPRRGDARAVPQATLVAEEQAYVAFHLETLECPTCQARQGEAELVQSPEARRRASPSKRKVPDASIKLMGEMNKGGGRK